MLVVATAARLVPKFSIYILLSCKFPSKSGKHSDQGQVVFGPKYSNVPRHSLERVLGLSGSDRRGINDLAISPLSDALSSSSSFCPFGAFEFQLKECVEVRRCRWRPKSGLGVRRCSMFSPRLMTLHSSLNSKFPVVAVEAFIINLTLRCLIVFFQNFRDDHVDPMVPNV